MKGLGSNTVRWFSGSSFLQYPRGIWRGFRHCNAAMWILKRYLFYVSRTMKQLRYQVYNDDVSLSSSGDNAWDVCIDGVWMNCRKELVCKISQGDLKSSQRLQIAIVASSAGKDFLDLLLFKFCEFGSRNLHGVPSQSVGVCSRYCGMFLENIFICIDLNPLYTLRNSVYV